MGDSGSVLVLRAEEDSKMGTSRRPQPLRLGAKLRQIRGLLELTQEQIGKRLETPKSPVHPGHISEFETGKREPSLLVLLAYARMAGVSMETLVDDAIEIPLRLPRRQRGK
jgi:transcriptional regulator with XRE-family HTH domain